MVSLSEPNQSFVDPTLHSEPLAELPRLSVQ